MRRAGRPALSPLGQQVLDPYERQLRTVEDLTAAPIRNYLSDLHHFAGWYESRGSLGREEALAFRPEAITTPTITDYRAYLQQTLRLKTNSVNRALISLKRYFAWLVSTGHLKYDPAKVVKLVGEEVLAPRHLDDQEEQRLLAAVTEAGSLRVRAIVVLLLHTGLRVRELYTLTRAHVRLGKRSGTIWVLGKGNKEREIPLNATARAALLAYDPSLTTPSDDPTPLFLSEKRHTQFTGRGLGYLVQKYAERAHVRSVSPHALRHRFGYRMAASVPLHRLAQLMGHDSLNTTMRYVQASTLELQQDIERIAWR